MKTRAMHQALSRHDLVQLLNWELAAYERRAGTRFTSIKSAASAEASGCNWRDARVKSDHSLDRRGRRVVPRGIAPTRREVKLACAHARPAPPASPSFRLRPRAFRRGPGRSALSG